MVRASRESNMHSIATTGYICQKFLSKKIDDLSINQMADLMILDIVDGMDGISHTAGVIKDGTSYNYITPSIPHKGRWAWNRLNLPSKKVWTVPED
jgi:5-phospho-D-xylono-1,4-lactonase